MSKNKILVIVPTKDRLDDFKIFADSWVNTNTGKSDVLVGIDVGDTTYDSIKDIYPFIYEHITPKPFLHILNELANKYADEYDYISFMEDDCKFVTYGWDGIFIDKINEIGDNAIVWGNDLLNKDRLVGLPFMNSKIVRRLGYMSPHELKCLYVDNFWLALGRRLNSLYYFDDVIIEHRHYSTGKRTIDNISVSVDHKITEDGYAFNNVYMPNRFNNDVEKLLLK